MTFTRIVARFERAMDILSQFAETRHGWRVLVILLLLAACGAMTWYLAADVDLFTRVATGRLIENLGTIPLSDPWAYTPRKSVWHEHEIVPCILFYFVSQNGGDAALFTLKCLFTVVTLSLVIFA